MKKILKIIFIGLIAGLTYKFLADKNFKPGEKLSDIREWIVSKSKELENLSKDDKALITSGENNQRSAYNNGSSNIPSNESKSSGALPLDYAAIDNRAYMEPSSSHVSANDSEAEAYPIVEKKFPGNDRFPELDKYARETPRDSEATIESLAIWLTRPASNELEKARLLFTWITTNVSYDDNGFNTGNYSDTSPEGVLKNRVSVCQGYSELFTAMCKKAGLEAVTINGYAKGITYRMGEGFNRTNHAWNAVKTDGEWRLFDVTWAAGYGKGVNGRLVTTMKFDDYWFNTGPDEFIFTHLPEEESSQLNQPKISLSQFESMPYVSSEYFKLGFGGNQEFTSVLSGNVMELPKAYMVEGDITMLSMPYARRIPSGKAIKVRIKSADAIKIAYTNGGGITDMNNNGDEFSTVISPVHGPLRLMAMFGNDERNYNIFLDYEVE